MRQLNSVTSENKSQVTVVACVSAAIHNELTKGEIHKKLYGLSKKGWIDVESFELWFKRHFLHYAPLQRPLLLLLDAHSSHFQLFFIKRALMNNVVFCLPQQKMHLAQHLDETCSSPLKAAWHEECFLYVFQLYKKGSTDNNLIRSFVKYG